MGYFFSKARCRQSEKWIWKSFFGSEADDPARFALPTPIDQFASDYLNLKVSFQKLSSDGSIYGLNAYVDTEYQIEVDGSQRSIFLKTNDVVLDKSFIEPANIRKLCGKRRFTLAHECAHQILFQLDAQEYQSIGTICGNAD